MPFDPAPIQTPAKVGTYQRYADAMLRGCAITKQTKGRYFREGASCAIGAMYIGLGLVDPETYDPNDALPDRGPEDEVWNAYLLRYGTSIIDDNDSGMTREQIAARIAAL